MATKRVKETRASYRAKRKSAAKPRPTKITLNWADVESAAEPIVLERNGRPVAVVVKYSSWVAAIARKEATPDEAKKTERRERILGYAGIWLDLPAETWAELKHDFERRAAFFTERSADW
jgi:hypothetical protein